MTATATRRVFVLSWAPAYDETDTGGCLWRSSWEDLLAKTGLITPGHDYRITTLDLPAAMSDSKVTAFLGGKGADVVDPPDPRRDLADTLSDYSDGDGPTCHECEAQGATQYLPCPAHHQETKP